MGSRPAKGQSVANGSFESGSFTSAGAFAGGTTNASFAPTSWSPSLNASFSDAKWVQSTAARSGTKYGYATSIADVNSNNDACLQYNVSGLTVGNCYTLTVYAAEAGGPVNNPAGNPGLMTLEFANGSAPSGGFEYGRFFLPNNTQWSDTALTPIPWAVYTYTFKAQLTTFNLWVSANAYNGQRGSVVFDDVSIAPATCPTADYDYGDLPLTSNSTNNTFNTTGGGTAANAPRHLLGSNLSLRLGSAVDTEANGQPSTNADGDDLALGPDEDGVTFGTLTAGSAATITAYVVRGTGGTAKLNAWIDWNGNGTFETSERIANDLTVNASSNIQSPTANVLSSVTVPTVASGNVVLGRPLAARFRLSSSSTGLTATGGAAADGEIEDYMVFVTGGVDWGDLPDDGSTGTTGAGNYRTKSTRTGAGLLAPRHNIINSLVLGSVADAETGTFGNAAATADDSNNIDDEDGVDLSTIIFVQGLTAQVPVTVSKIGGGTAILNAFFDFNNNGVFTDSGEAMTPLTVNIPFTGSKLVYLPVAVPAAATTGANLGARFRISTAGGLLSTDTAAAADGEVEDYIFSVAAPTVRLGNRVWIDTDNSGTINGAEVGLNGVTVQVFAADGSGNATGSALATTTTATFTNPGYYSFNLLPGNYVVVVPASNFGSGQPLVGKVSSGTSNGTFNGIDPDTTPTDSDDNGTNDTDPATTGVRSAAVTLTVGGEPTGEDNANGLGGFADNSVNFTVDFGFVNTPAKTVRLGNRVWIDNGVGSGGVANDGILNGTEPGTNGVTVQIFNVDLLGNPTGPALASTTTASAGGVPGYYAFDLFPGTYVVVIPASNFATGAVLAGMYSSGSAPTVCCNGIADGNTVDSKDNGYNAIRPGVNGVNSAPVTLTVGGEPTGEDAANGLGGFADNSVNFTVDFGFVASAPTAIKLAYVKGWWAGGQVTVEWETVSELETLGFDLYRLEGGKRIRVNADLVAALNIERGGVYRVTEAMTKPTGPLSYLLVEQEITGKLIEYGPFTVLVQSGASVSSVDAKGGGLEFRFSGEPGATYQVESTGDMVHGRWTRVGTATADADGVLLFHQPVGGSDPVRFYRALKP